MHILMQYSHVCISSDLTSTRIWHSQSQPTLDEKYPERCLPVLKIYGMFSLVIIT